jgi:hypothetical protein
MSVSSSQGLTSRVTTDCGGANEIQVSTCHFENKVKHKRGTYLRGRLCLGGLLGSVLSETLSLDALSLGIFLLIIRSEKVDLIIVFLSGGCLGGRSS